MLHEQTGEKERLLGLWPHPLPISNPEHSQGSRKNEALLIHPLAMAMALAPGCCEDERSWWWTGLGKATLEKQWCDASPPRLLRSSQGPSSRSVNTSSLIA